MTNVDVLMLAAITAGACRLCIEGIRRGDR